MNLDFRRIGYHQKEFNQYFDTFRRPFWIECQWFFRCHWGLWAKFITLHLYSLPYAFSDYPCPNEPFNLQTESTCPDDLLFSYHSIRQITYEPWMFNDRMMPQIQLMNIEQLSVGLPFDSRFLSVFPTFVKLTSLTINILPTDCQSAIQSVLDRSSHLQTLKFSSWTTMTKPPYRLLSPSIRRLDLEGRDPQCQKYSYNAEQCVELCRSPLGRQCQVLTVQVKDVACIAFLMLMTRTNLRILQVNVEAHNMFQKDNLLQILQESIPSNWNVTRSCSENLILRSGFLNCH